jgi:hypothetical protein
MRLNERNLEDRLNPLFGRLKLIASQDAGTKQQSSCKLQS